MDSGGSPASPRLVLHQCSSPLNRVIGPFASIRRANRLCTVPQTRHRMRGLTRFAGLQGFEPLSFQDSLERSLCVSLQLPTAALSDWNAPKSRSTRSCRSDRRDVCTHRGRTAQTRTPFRECAATTGVPIGSWHQPGTHGVLRQGDVPIWSSASRRI